MTEKINLILSPSTIREIVEEVYSKFMLHTENISFHFEEHAIHIIVYPGRETQFILEGDPVDVRLDNTEHRWEWIRRHRVY